MQKISSLVNMLSISRSSGVKILFHISGNLGWVSLRAQLGCWLFEDAQNVQKTP